MSIRHPEPAAVTPPLTRLCIYYIEGRVQPAGLDLGEAFIGNWEEDGFSFLFFSEPQDDVVKRHISAHPALRWVDRYTMSYEDWLGERFTGFTRDGFTVRPAWAASVPPPGGEAAGLEILLDPGVVFGTGTHTTTQDCLSALGLLYRTTQPKTVLDLGTGTGLLAVAAAKLGARRVAAVDLNLLAVRTARHNIRINGVEDRVVAAQGRAELLVDCPADLLIANIHYDTLKRLVDGPVFERFSFFILSGMMRSESRAVEAVLAKMPVHILNRWDTDGVWFTYLGQGRFRSGS